MADFVKVLNTIRATASPSYQERVPVATQTNLSSVGNPILEYTLFQNEFLSALVNKIAMTIVHGRTMHNPLAMLKQGTFPLGMDIEEIGVNPATAETYNAQSTDLLAQKKPDVKVAYHRLNRQDRYTVSITKPQLAQAFTSWNAFGNLVEAIVNSLYSGNYLDEFLLTKNLFGSAIADNKMITETINPITDEASAKAFIKKARMLYTNFGIPSNKYNAWDKIKGEGETSFTTWTPKENINIIIRSDVEASLDVDVLASAFNIDKSVLLGNILIVDDFGTAENCLAILADKAFTQIYEQLNDMEEFHNGSNLTWNYYLHVWQTYSISPFANAVAFVTPTPDPDSET